MRCAEMAYASSVGNAHSSQVPTVKKSDKWLKLTKMCVLAGWGPVPRPHSRERLGRTSVGRFLGNRLKSCLRTTAKSGDYPLWNVLPLWEMAIPFPFPVKKPGNNRIRVSFGPTVPTKTPPTPPWHGGGTPPRRRG